MQTSIDFYRNSSHSDRPPRRFYKLIYTAALRLGKSIDLDTYKISFDFEGEYWPEVPAHNDAKAYKGTLSINGDAFKNVIVILKEHHPSKFHIITFWPDTQHPDAKHSYTDILVEVAMEGKAFPPSEVVEKMHPKFVENPGVSPGALLLLIHEEDKEYFASQLSGNYEIKIDEITHDLNSVLIELERAEAINLENLETITNLKEQSADDAKIIEDQAQIIAKQDEEIKRLQSQTKMQEKPGTLVSRSESPAIILDVKVEHGSNWRGPTKTIALYMSDDSVRRNNWKNGFDERLKLANLLKERGTPVTTDVWNSPDKPDFYKACDWFKNIYTADAD